MQGSVTFKCLLHFGLANSASLQDMFGAPLDLVDQQDEQKTNASGVSQVQPRKCIRYLVNLKATYWMNENERDWLVRGTRIFTFFPFLPPRHN
ncbi:uncharacterized protein EDB91DRAFT_1154928, partial [Suillus paluster]|uniref:uncharacterized protein n=1 Tax=Suillus paluster TaxID=48578 RepID=UPI001B878679